MALARLAFKLAPKAQRIVDSVLKGKSLAKPVKVSLGYVHKQIDLNGYNVGIKNAKKLVGKDMVDAYKYLLTRRHYQLFGKEGLKTPMNVKGFEIYYQSKHGINAAKRARSRMKKKNLSWQK